MSVWSLQNDGFMSIGNAASYVCAAFGCSEFVCLRGLTLSISPFVCLCVRQPIIHDLNILSFDSGSVVADRHGGTDTSPSCVLLPSSRGRIKYGYLDTLQQ